MQISEEHSVNQNTAGCQRSLSRTVLSHTMALSILLLHSLDRDINKKRKQAITVTKALTAQGKWHVNSASGRLKLAGNNHAPFMALKPFLTAVWVGLSAVEQGACTFFPCTFIHILPT